MSSTTTSISTRQDAAPDWVTAAWQAIRDQLLAKQNQLYEEIANYPPPIPACDQHFNYLLEQRTAIALELRRQKALAEKSLTSCDPVVLIDTFVESSIYLNDDAKHRVRACLPHRDR